MKPTPFHDGMKCHVLRIEYDFVSQIGILYMPPVCCCDMQGCIDLFEAIDPKVDQIRTFGGDRQDTSYHLVAGIWEARMPARGVGFPAQPPC